MEQLFEALSSKIYEKYKTNISEQYQEFEDLSGYVATQFSRKDPAPSYSEYQKEVLKQGWEHFQKKILEKGHNTNIMNFVDSYDQFRGGQTSALKGMYQNTGYGRERQEMQSLVLDSDDDGVFSAAAHTSTTFSFDLAEPLIIDKLSNVFLDNFIVYNAIKNTEDTTGTYSALLLNIDQFNIQTKGSGLTSGTPSSTTIYKNGKILIPNEATDDSSGTAQQKIFKGKKFNYVAQINPKKITKITGSITNIGLNGGAHSSESILKTVDSRFIVEFLIVAAEKMPWK